MAAFVLAVSPLELLVEKNRMKGAEEEQEEEQAEQRVMSLGRKDR